jgi:hypothetical protein
LRELRPSFETLVFASEAKVLLDFLSFSNIAIQCSKLFLRLILGSRLSVIASFFASPQVVSVLPDLSFSNIKIRFSKLLRRLGAGSSPQPSGFGSSLDSAPLAEPEDFSLSNKEKRFSRLVCLFGLGLGSSAGISRGAFSETEIRFSKLFLVGLVCRLSRFTSGWLPFRTLRFDSPNFVSVAVGQSHLLSCQECLEDAHAFPW